MRNFILSPYYIVLFNAVNISKKQVHFLKKLFYLVFFSFSESCFFTVFRLNSFKSQSGSFVLGKRRLLCIHTFNATPYALIICLPYQLLVFLSPLNDMRVRLRYIYLCMPIKAQKLILTFSFRPLLSHAREIIYAG